MERRRKGAAPNGPPLGGCLRNGLYLALGIFFLEILRGELKWRGGFLFPDGRLFFSLSLLLLAYLLAGLILGIILWALGAVLGAVSPRLGARFASFASAALFALYLGWGLPETASLPFRLLLFAAALFLLALKIRLDRALLFLFAATALLFLLFNLTSHRRIESSWKGRGSVFLIVLDSFRADLLSSLGNPNGITPNLDRLASESVLFTDVWSQAPWTRPSVTSLFTSRYPSEIGVFRKGKLSGEVETVTEILERHNVPCVAFSDNYVVSSLSGVERGFRLFNVTSRYFLINNSLPGRLLPKHFRRRAMRWLRNFYCGAPSLLRQYGRIIGKGFRGFVFFHFMETHYPYYPHTSMEDNRSRLAAPEDFIPAEDLVSMVWEEAFPASIPATEKQIGNARLRYEGEAQYLDGQLGEFFDRLKREGLWEKSLLIVTADHGEEFLEHGLWGHGQSLYEELIHVPLIIKPPSSWRIPPRRIDTPVMLLDVAPTVLNFFSLSGKDLRGRSLLPLLRGEGLLPGEGGKGETQLSELYRRGKKVTAVKRGDAKLIGGEIKRGSDKEKILRLFRLDRDPGETNNLAGDEPELAADLQGLIRDHLSTPAKGAEGEELSREEVDMLRALGYVQ